MQKNARPPRPPRDLRAPRPRGSRRRALAPLLLAVAPLAGCSSYVAPTLDVTGARVTERTDEGLALAFTVDAANTNDDALPLREATYSLELDGTRVFTGVRSPEATLRRRGTQQFILPAGISYAALASAAGKQSVRYRLSGSVEYITPGAFAEVLFDTGVRRPKASFAGEGTIDLAAVPVTPAPTPPAASEPAP